MSKLDTSQKNLKSRIFRAINITKLNKDSQPLITSTIKKQSNPLSKTNQQTSALLSPNHKASSFPLKKLNSKLQIIKQKQHFKANQLKNSINKSKPSVSKQKHHNSVYLMQNRTERYQANIYRGNYSSSNINKSKINPRNLQRQKLSLPHHTEHTPNSKVHLVSHTEHSSPQEVIVTPHKTKIKNHSYTQQQFNDKDQYQFLSPRFKRKVGTSFSQPEKFQSLMKSDVLRVSYRILKKRLIEIQIYVLKNIDGLNVTLQKGNLECQNIQQTYTQLPENTVLSLLSSVRKLNIDSLLDLPQLLLQLTLAEDCLPVQKLLIIPFTWLHLIQQIKNPSSKRNSIRTKVCVSTLRINVNNFKILSQVMVFKLKKISADRYEYESHFQLEKQQLSLKIIEHSKHLDLQLQGRGEQNLRNMMQFLSQLLC